jgi:hypothetical protein
VLLYSEGDTPHQESDAHEVMTLLTVAYPGHPWAARVAGGVIFIRYLEPSLPGHWGMVVKVNDVQHDAAVLKKRVIMAAGEWLERAGLKRGRENGDEIVSVEGVPLPKTARFDDIEINAAPLRDTPRPQALG